MTVKWGEMDTYAHVNNTVYFKYQEVARLKYFAELMKHVDPTLFDVPGFMEGKAIGPILADSRCVFKFPLTFPDRLLVGATIAPGDMHSKRCKLTHGIWSLRHGRVVSDGDGTWASYDFQQGKSVPLPPQLVHAVHQVESGDSLHLLSADSPGSLLKHLGVNEETGVASNIGEDEF